MLIRYNYNRSLSEHLLIFVEKVMEATLSYTLVYGLFPEHEKSVKVHARNRAGTKRLTSLGLRPR